MMAPTERAVGVTAWILLLAAVSEGRMILLGVMTMTMTMTLL